MQGGWGGFTRPVGHFASKFLCPCDVTVRIAPCHPQLREGVVVGCGGRKKPPHPPSTLRVVRRPLPGGERSASGSAASRVRGRALFLPRPNPSSVPFPGASHDPHHVFGP